MGSLKCFCGYGMRNSDSLNQVELSLFTLDDINDAVRKQVLLKELPFLYKETEVWRCPSCGRWNFLSQKYDFRMVPQREILVGFAQAQSDDVLFFEYDLRSVDKAYQVSENIRVEDFLNLSEKIVRLRFIRVNKKRMLLFKTRNMQKPIKLYLQEKA